MKKLIYFSVFIIVFVGCKDLLKGGHNQTPYDKLTKKNAFNTEKELQLYINSMYNVLPTGNNIIRSDNMSDYLSLSTVPNYLIPNGYDSRSTGGWSWGELRNINYFLKNAPKSAKEAGVDEDIIDNYIGIARFFRALFYFKKVKRYGKVPWYNEPLEASDSTDLFKPRDKRTLVMDNVLDDINYAVNNINKEKDETCSKITKWVALAFKSRICLFEGTFRKYHSAELDIENTADKWLQESANASDKVMQSGLYTIHVNTSDNSLSYRDLFTDESGHPPADETILAFNASSDKGIYTDTNWFYTSPTYGYGYGFNKQFIDTYLNLDGTRFTDQINYDKIVFWEEVKNRDLRLQQTIHMGDYKRADGTPAPPNFSYQNTGYQPLKYLVDSRASDNSRKSIQSIPIIRYAEVLLNNAEAKAELKEFNNGDWNKTIKVLRERAGINDPSMPSTADTYLQNTYFPNISDPVLLEIRRERGIELTLEGFRFDDLRRWDRGKLLEMPYKGMYVPKINVAYDLNQDGTLDVSFVHQTPDPEDQKSGVVYVNINNDNRKLSKGNKGNIIWQANQQKEWKKFKTFYPIPFDEIVRNPNLEQNPGW